MWDNADVVAGYAVWRDTLCAAVHVEEPEPGAPDQRGTFALSVTPPGASVACFAQQMKNHHELGFMLLGTRV